ncbi:MAG: hemerythrin domain-containing protein [Bacteroidetes bacterium]|nr:hemerythrin domain-containing protein [Bacteroidota bacterium]
MMERHKALHSLSHDHHHGLILAQLIKKGSPQYKNLPNTTEGKKDYSIRFYNYKLIKHFESEEKILFPVVNGKNDEIDNLIEEIIIEHKKIKLLINQLESDKDVENTLDELGRILESHIRKEERKLFPLIQNLLSDEELIYLENKLQNFVSEKNMNFITNQPSYLFNRKVK